MTRDEALLKLLAVEPERQDELIRVTGWPDDETRDTLRRLFERGAVAFRQSINGEESGRVYFVK